MSGTREAAATSSPAVGKGGTPLRIVAIALGVCVLAAAIAVGLLVRQRAQRKAAIDGVIAGHLALGENRLAEARNHLTEVDPARLERMAIETWVNDLALTHFRLGDWKSQLELADRTRNDPMIPVRRLAPYILIDGLALAKNGPALVHVVDSILSNSRPSPSSALGLLSRATDRAALAGLDSAARVLAIAFTQLSEQQRDSTPLAIVFAMHVIGRDAEAVHIADSVDAYMATMPSRGGAANPRAGTETFRAIAHLWAGDSALARTVLAARRADAGADPRGTRHLQAASLAAQLGLRAEAIALLREVVPRRLTFNGGWPESVLLLPLRNESEFKALIAPK